MKKLCLILALVMLAGGCGPSIEQYRSQGVTQLQNGDREQAERNFLQVLSQKPSDPPSLYYMGVLKQSQGDHVAAMYYYQSAIDADPTLTAAKIGLARAKQQAGEAGKHLTFIPQSVAQPPTNGN